MSPIRCAKCASSFEDSRKLGTHIGHHHKKEHWEEAEAKGMGWSWCPCRKPVETEKDLKYHRAGTKCSEYYRLQNVEGGRIALASAVAVEASLQLVAPSTSAPVKLEPHQAPIPARSLSQLDSPFSSSQQQLHRSLATAPSITSSSSVTTSTATVSASVDASVSSIAYASSSSAFRPLSPSTQVLISTDPLKVRIRNSSAVSPQSVRPEPRAVSQPAAQSSTRPSVSSSASLSLQGHLLRPSPAAASSCSSLYSSTSTSLNRRDPEARPSSSRATIPAGDGINAPSMDPQLEEVVGSSQGRPLPQELEPEARKKVEEQTAQLKRERENLRQRQEEEVEKKGEKRKKKMEDLMVELEGLDEELERIVMRKEVVKQAIMRTARE